MLAWYTLCWHSGHNPCRRTDFQSAPNAFRDVRCNPLFILLAIEDSIGYGNLLTAYTHTLIHMVKWPPPLKPRPSYTPRYAGAMEIKWIASSHNSKVQVRFEPPTLGLGAKHLNNCTKLLPHRYTHTHIHTYIHIYINTHTSGVCMT